MKRVLIFAFALVIASGVQAEEYKNYGTYDLRGILKTSKADGKDQHSIDMHQIARVVGDLAAHARDYPPNFKSGEEKARAEQDASTLSDVLDILASDKSADANVVLQAADVNSIAHNLDIKGAAAKADSYYQRLLKRDPDHPTGNFHYGVFLVGTATKQKDSIPYLEKALKLGVDGARYTLGLAYLMMGDNAKALDNLEAYAKQSPDDPRPKKLIDAINHQNIRFEKQSK